MRHLITVVLVITQCHLFAFRDIKSTFYFDSDIDTLNAVQYKELLEFIKSTSSNNQYKEIYIVGYTDSDGSSNYNIDLSKRRANNVSELLLKNGLPEVLIDKNFKGEGNPVLQNISEINKSKNRRVEIILRVFDIKTATDVVKEMNGNPEQVFILDNTKENFIEGKNGMRFIFPPDCFATPANQKPDLKKIKVVLTEVTNATQGFFSNVLAESNEGLLESGGMYKLTVFSNNTELKMKDNLYYTVQINKKNVQDNMTVYSPQNTILNGLVKWENTNTSFEKSTSFKGKRPYLELNDTIIKNWHLVSELDSFLKNYNLILPVKPVKPIYPSKLFAPVEPVITASKYKIPWYRKMFMSKSKQQKIIHEAYENDMVFYQKQLAKYKIKLAKYVSDTASYPERFKNYHVAYKAYEDTLKQKVQEMNTYRLAVYQDAFVRSFEYGKNSILFKLRNKILYSHDIYADILEQCNKLARVKDFDERYLKLYSDANKKLDAAIKYEFPYLKFYKNFMTSSNSIYNMVYPLTCRINLHEMMRKDKEVVKHIATCMDKLTEEEVKLGLFNPVNFNTFYQASLNTFGWINCDRYAGYKQEDIFTLQIPDYNFKDKNIFAIVKDISSQISIPLTKKGMYSIRLPKNKDIVIVAIGLKDDLTPAYAKQTINQQSDINLKLDFKTAKLSEIRDMIMSI
ncbi:MAG: OmpA family protein [Chitinophagales bacterium]